MGMPSPFETRAIDRRVLEMGGGFHDGACHSGRVLGLEDARPDEHPLGARAAS